MQFSSSSFDVLAYKKCSVFGIYFLIAGVSLLIPYWPTQKDFEIYAQEMGFYDDISCFGPVQNYSGSGWLFLTSDKLIYKYTYNLSNMYKDNKKDKEILIKDIEGYRLYNVFSILPKGIEFKYKNGKSEKFIVEQRHIWEESLKKVFNNL